MDNISDLDEIINEVFIDIKEMYYFLELNDLDIYKLIRRSVGKNKTITRDELLNKVSNYYSKQLVKSISDDRYDDIDKFFENSFVCLEKYDSLKKLSDLLCSVSIKVERELYIKLFRRYDVLSNMLIDMLEEYNYSIVKIKEVVLDRELQKILQIYFEFCDSDNIGLEQNGVEDRDYAVKNAELIRNYYQNHDEKILEEFIILNMPLVKSIAKRYKCPDLSYDDLVQEGLIGLLKAIDKFDFNSNAKLSSYAYISIERCIARAINNDSRSIRIPVWRCEELKKYNLEKRNFISKYGFVPKNEDMARLLNISLDKVKENEFLLSDYVSSLSFKIDKENDVELGEILEDKNSISPEDYAIRSCMKKDINEILEQVLTEQEKIVIDLAFGRYDGVVRNNVEVGMLIYEYGLYPKPLTRERVRQLRSGAIKKLQSSSYVKKLESYL